MLVDNWTVSVFDLQTQERGEIHLREVPRICHYGWTESFIERGVNQRGADGVLLTKLVQSRTLQHGACLVSRCIPAINLVASDSCETTN